MGGPEGVVHRRTFQNTNQVVELTIRTIPKAIHCPAPPPPPHTVARECRAKNDSNKMVARVNKGARGDPTNRLAGDPSKGSQVTVEVRQKKSGHTRKSGSGGWEEKDASLSSSSSSSSVSSKRAGRKIIEEYVIEAATSSTPPPASAPPLPNPSQLSSNPNSSSLPHPPSPHTSQQSSSPPPPAPSSLPPPATPASTPHHTISHTHPHQAQHNARLLSDDVTPSPFGKSALIYLRQLRELLEARGLGEERALVGVLEAFITGQGSAGGVGEEPSPPATTTNTATQNNNTSCERNAPPQPPPPPPPSPPQHHHHHIREIERLRQVVADQEKVISDLKRLSSHLILQQEQMVGKKNKKSKTDTDKEDEEEREIGTDRNGEGQEETDRHGEKTQREKEEEERPRNEEKLERMNQENRKLREQIVNLEIQLTRTSRLLEIERQHHPTTTTSVTAHTPPHRSPPTVPPASHPPDNPLFNLHTRTDPQLPTLLPPGTPQHIPLTSQSQGFHTHPRGQSYISHGIPVSQSHTLPQPNTPQVVPPGSTPPQKLHPRPHKPPSRSHTSESEVDSAYEKTGSQLTSKTSTPPSSVRPVEIDSTSSRVGAAQCQGNRGVVAGSRTMLEGSRGVLEGSRGMLGEGGGGVRSVAMLRGSEEGSRSGSSIVGSKRDGVRSRVKLREREEEPGRGSGLGSEASDATRPRGREKGSRSGLGCELASGGMVRGRKDGSGSDSSVIGSKGEGSEEGGGVRRSSRTHARNRNGLRMGNVPALSGDRKSDEDSSVYCVEGHSPPLQHHTSIQNPPHHHHTSVTKSQPHPPPPPQYHTSIQPPPHHHTTTTTTTTSHPPQQDTTITQHSLHHHTKTTTNPSAPPHPPQHSSSEASTHSLPVPGHRRRHRRKKLPSKPRSSEIKLSDQMQRWLSQETIEFSSLSTLGELDLISSRSTQESSFLQGIMSARRTPTVTPHSTSPALETGSLVMESTRVPGRASNEGTDTQFVDLEAATPSLEVLRKSVDLLD